MLLFPALAVALYLLFPWLVSRAAPLAAASLGLTSLELTVERPGLGSLRIERLQLAGSGFHVAARDGQLSYDLRRLLSGRLDGIEVATLAVRVDPSSRGGDAPAGELPGPEMLFDLLPAETVTVRTLVLEIPEMDFRAVGALEVAARELNVRLEGRSPAAAERLTLGVRLAGDGVVHLRLAEPGSGGAPLVLVSSEVEPGRVRLDGELALRGFVLDLAVELLGLAAGEGALSGSFTASAPWPLPEDWPLAWEGAGRLAGGWRAAGAEWAVEDATAHWRAAGGTLSGGVQGTVGYGGDRLPAAATVERLGMEGAQGRGTLLLGASVAADGGSGEESGSPGTAASGARLVWRLAADALDVEGSVRLAGPLMARAAAAAGLDGVEGAATAELDARLPWPLPESWQSLRPPSSGTLAGRWQWPAGDLGVEVTKASWRLVDRRLSGSVDLRAIHGGIAVSPSLELDRLTLEASGIDAEGTVTVGTDARLPFTLSHDPDAAAGRLQAEGLVDVRAPLGETLVSGWSEPYDVTGGRLALAADVGWGGPEPTRRRIRVDLQNVTAHYADYRLSGLSGSLGLSAEAAGAWTLAPAPLTAASLHTGVTFSDVVTGVAYAAKSVTVQPTTARVLGGSVRVDAFAYRLDTGRADFVVDLTDLDLARVLALEGEHVSGTGTIDGTLPVRLRENLPSVVAGRVHADPPGGVLRVSPALAGDTGQPGLDFALRALGNFRYSVLEADVAYGENGDLTLGVHLQGRNPEVEGGRPIHYNVNVNENLPTLLKSLRLQDQVTRQIEREVND